MALLRYNLVLLFSYTLLSGCQPDNIVNIDELDAGAESEAAGEFVRLINEARAQERQCGNDRFEATSSVEWNDTLAQAALAHSNDMAQNDFFSHTGSDGKNARTRAERAGYQARTLGENIAAGYPSIGSTVVGWLESPGHCANIMNPNYSEIGAASVERAGTTYGIYWTLVLGASF